MAAFRLAVALLAACAACADARRVTLEKAAAAAHAGHAHGATSTPGAGAPATRAGGVETLAPGLYRASYELPLRPMLPGEVLITQAGNTLLDHPHGRVAVLDMQFDIVDDKNASMPLDRLYNHHFVIAESSGVSLPQVQAGAQWPPPLTSGAATYAALAAANVSFNAGPCEYARYIYGGGAEWRGAQRDAAFDPRAPLPAATWLTAESDTAWGLNLHLIDLRGVSNVRDCVQCSCAYFSQRGGGAAARDADTQAPLPGGGVQCCPDGARCDADGAPTPAQYTFRYAVTYSNDTALLSRTKAVIRSVLTTESFAASNGFTCGVEYNPSTCGATPTEPAGSWAAESTCVADAAALGGDDKTSGAPPPGARTVRATQLAFSWTVPPTTDIELRYAYGHQHVGARGIRLFAVPPGAPPNATGGTLLCESRPVYGNGTAGAARGFLASMTACDFRMAPRLLPRGTQLRVESRYHADSTPMPETAFQLPWQGTMGYMNLEYTIAAGSAFGVITATGAQELPRAATELRGDGAAAPASAAASPVCLARAAPAGESLLSASLVEGMAAPAPSSDNTVVLATAPVLFTMQWDIDAARQTVAITLSVNETGRWLGIGLHSPGAAQRGMLGADMAVVQRQQPGAPPEIAEYYADAYARPTRKADVGGGSGLSLCAAEAVAGGGARVTFTRPLKGAADGQSADVVPGASASVAWALGAGPSLAMHAAAGRATVVW